MTFGALSLAGGSLTMATIAALPVLIGLAVDYAIQFQARHDEVRRRERLAAAEAAPRAAAAGGPTIATAGIATAVGFLVLLLSPVPMVRGFGALTVVGIVLALACALTAGFAALVRFEGRSAPSDLPPLLPARARAGARQRGRRSPLGRRAVGAPGTADRRPPRVGGVRACAGLRRSEAAQRILAVGLAVAVLGWAVDTQSEVVSDVRELVPRDLQALQDVNDAAAGDGGGRARST